MPGAKGSGGARPNSGPKPQSFTLKLGAKLLLRQRTPEGSLLGELVEVTAIDRVSATLTNAETGDTYLLMR